MLGKAFSPLDFISWRFQKTGDKAKRKKQGQKVVNKNVSQGCNLIKRL